MKGESKMIPGTVIRKDGMETTVEEQIRRKKIKSLQRKNKRNKRKGRKKC